MRLFRRLREPLNILLPETTCEWGGVTYSVSAWVFILEAYELQRARPASFRLGQVF